MTDKHTEWLRQAEYDLETAQFMISGQRYFYAVFMCHLAVEKALKGLYQNKLQDVPPKTHNLIYLLDKNGVRPAEPMGKFIARLSEANIAALYPEDLDLLQARYTASVAVKMVEQTKEVFEWIKKQF